MKASKSIAAADRTIAALRFHAERIKEKSGDGPTASTHNEILGNMVDLHHRNMSMVGASLLKFEPLESLRTSDRMIEVEEFDPDNGGGGNGDDDADDDEEEEEGEQRSGSQSQSRSRHASSTLNDPSPDLVIQLKSSPSVSAKKAVQDPLDPVLLFRQMRAATMSRTASQHIPGIVKGAYAFVQPPPELDQDDEDSGKSDLAWHRAKSFLRPETTASPADEMLAQIRGRKWDSECSVTVKGSRSMTGKAPEHTALTPSKSDLRAEGPRLSSSLGTSPGSVYSGGSKSFSIAPSGLGKRTSALPGVSVDTPPSVHLSGDFERMPVRHSTGEGSPAGLLSRIKNIMKR